MGAPSSRMAVLPVQFGPTATSPSDRAPCVLPLCVVMVVSTHVVLHPDGLSPIEFVNALHSHAKGGMRTEDWNSSCQAIGGRPPHSSPRSFPLYFRAVPGAQKSVDEKCIADLFEGLGPDRRDGSKPGRLLATLFASNTLESYVFKGGPPN